VKISIYRGNKLREISEALAAFRLPLLQKYYGLTGGIDSVINDQNNSYTEAHDGLAVVAYSDDDRIVGAVLGKNLSGAANASLALQKEGLDLANFYYMSSICTLDSELSPGLDDELLRQLEEAAAKPSLVTYGTTIQPSQLNDLLVRAGFRQLKTKAIFPYPLDIHAIATNQQNILTKAEAKARGFQNVEGSELWELFEKSVYVKG
jgi:hypothetical protein